MPYFGASTPTGSNGNQSNRTLVSYRGATRCPNGETITKLGVYSSTARDITMKIAEEVSNTEINVVASEQFSHTGSGWEDITLTNPYTVPTTGDYNIGCYFGSGSIECDASLPKRFADGINVLSGSATVTGSNGWMPAMRGFYEDGQTTDPGDNSGEPTGNDGEYKTIAGAIRNTGSGWFLIEDGTATTGHEGLNITNVETVNGNSTSGFVRISYGFTGTKVVTMCITPDETYAQAGIIAGASVSRHEARIYFGKNGTPRSPNSVANANGNFWINGIIRS